MTTRKKILFEGQDVSLSSTMQKLQDKAEKASESLLDNYSKTGKASKDLNEQLQKEIQNQQRLAELSAADKRYQAAEKLAKKLEEINRKEEEHQKKLDTQRLRPRDREEAEKKAKEGFDEQRNAAGVVNDDTVSKLKESLEEQKRTNQLLKELIETDRVQWEEEVKNDRKSVENAVNQINRTGTDGMTAEQKAKHLYQSALLDETAAKKAPRGQSVLRDILGAGVIRDMGSLLGQMPNASDGYDMVPSMLRLSGAIGGGVLGAGAGAVAGLASVTPDPGGGALKGAAVGAEIGQRSAEIAGNALARFFTERENLEAASGRSRAITGVDFNPDTAMGFSKFGKTKAEGLEKYSQMAGSSGSIYNDVSAMFGAETGYGIDGGSLMGMVGSSRRTGGEFGKEIRNLLGTAEEGGIDRVLFNDLVKGQTQLINSIGGMTEKVDPKNITALMMEMNTIGGGFSLKDPRSLGMIQSLDSGLKGGNDFNQAMDLSVLRGMKPGGSVLDLLEIKQQGLATEEGREFFKGLIGQYKEMTGSEDQAVLSLMQRFGDIPISDLRKLVSNGGEVIGSMDTETMTAEADVTEQGNVARRAIMRSEVTDAFAVGAIEGMTKINDQMADLFEKALTKAMENINVGEMVTEGISKSGWGRTIPTDN